MQFRAVGTITHGTGANEDRLCRRRRGVGHGGGGGGFTRDQPRKESLLLLHRVVPRRNRAPGEIAGGFVVRSFPAFPDSEHRRVVLIEHVRPCRHPGVGTGLFLQVPEREHQGQTGVAPGFSHRHALRGSTQRDRRKRQQAHRQEGQQHHERKRNHQGKTPRVPRRAGKQRVRPMWPQAFFRRGSVGFRLNRISHLSCSCRFFDPAALRVDLMS